MLLTGACTVGLAAAFFHGVWSLDIEERRGTEGNKIKWGADGSISSPMEQKVVEDSDGVSFQNSRAGQPVHGLAPTPLPTAISPFVADASSPQITPAPVLFRRKFGSMRWDAIQDGFLAKRDSESCATNYQLCPQSLNGGCCPQNGYSCGTSSCIPVTASSASGCGFAGFIACDIANGGGCCPTNYICAAESCSPSPGVASLTCGVSSFQCPQSLGGGCCRNGMGCALSSCYNTNPVVFTYTDTVTTTDASAHTVTLTSTITSTTISGSPNPTATVGVQVPKVQGSATAVPKQPSTGTSSSSGLSMAAIGGIIAGVIAFLSLFLIAAIFIIRGLNRASKAQEVANSRASGSGSQGQSGMSGGHQPSGSREIETMEIDPLNHPPSTTSGSFRRPFSPSPPTPSIAEMAATTLPSPHSPRSPPVSYYNGYRSVPKDDQYSQPSSGGYSGASPDFSPRSGHNNSTSYFDGPHHHNNRGSLISSRPSHGRNDSNTSDISQSSIGSFAELDASPHKEHPQSPIQKFMKSLSFSRRKSGTSRPLPGGPNRAELTSTPIDTTGRGLGLGMLGNINEAGESRIAVDAHQMQMQQQEGSYVNVDLSNMGQPSGFRM